MLDNRAILKLSAICPGASRRDVDLAALSQWRIGGLAALMLRPRSTDQISRLRRALHDLGLPHVVIGQTSNLLFSDQGLAVPCLQMGPWFGGQAWQGDTVTVEAGAWVPGLARNIMQHGLTGAEHICGIPGTLGGLIVMNGGSQRRGIGENVVWVESVDARGQIQRRSQKECGFAYRSSQFQTVNEVVTRACLRFEPGDRDQIRAEMLRILADRRRKFPRKQPNCGSVFKSNPAHYAEYGPPGAIIESLGFKGQRRGGALVSPHHANFIVNTGEAKAYGVLHLIRDISGAVLRKTGHRMEAEVIFVRPDGRMMPVDQVDHLSLETCL